MVTLHIKNDLTLFRPGLCKFAQHFLNGWYFRVHNYFFCNQAWEFLILGWQKGKLLFRAQKNLIRSRRGKFGQNSPSFIRGDPVGSNRDPKNLTKSEAWTSMSEVVFRLVLSWDMLVSARNGVGNHFWGLQPQNNPKKRLCKFAQPRPES